MKDSVSTPLAHAATASPAPEWFAKAIGCSPDIQFVRSHQTDVEVLTWGERGRPGLLLVHGADGHAHWWAWTAPLLADRFRVAAMSLPGCGGSQWRNRYSSADFGDDAFACAYAAGLWDCGAPTYAGHSMGGAHLFHIAVHNPQHMRALMLIDSSFRTPALPQAVADRSIRIYESEADAFSHFRLMPPQQKPAPVLMGYVARKGLRQLTTADGGPGWVWRQDPNMLRRLEPGLEQGPYPATPIPVSIPLVHVMGDRSHVMKSPNNTPLAADVPRIVIPDCGHHVMMDQPAALVAQLRDLLTA